MFVGTNNYMLDSHRPHVRWLTAAMRKVLMLVTVAACSVTAGMCGPTSVWTDCCRQVSCYEGGQGAKGIQERRGNEQPLRNLVHYLGGRDE